MPRLRKRASLKRKERRSLHKSLCIHVLPETNLSKLQFVFCSAVHSFSVQKCVIKVLLLKYLKWSLTPPNVQNISCFIRIEMEFRECRISLDRSTWTSSGIILTWFWCRRQHSSNAAAYRKLILSSFYLSWQTVKPCKNTNLDKGSLKDLYFNSYYHMSNKWN